MAPRHAAPPTWRAVQLGRGRIRSTNRRPQVCKEVTMRVGVLTGGGDCPGLNAVIRAIVRKGEGNYGHSVIGFRHGWRGVLEDESIELDVASTRGLLPRGGTILGTSRTNPAKVENGIEKALDTLRSERIGALIVIGGEDTLGVALQ